MPRLLDYLVEEEKAEPRATHLERRFADTDRDECLKAMSVRRYVVTMMDDRPPLSLIHP